MLWAVVPIDATAAESISVLLQKGIYAEETEGNLDAAIKIYEGIIAESDANRSFVAQAQYRLGMCQLKKGSQDGAADTFRTLIERFPNQSEIVRNSRDRLKELGQSASSIVVRQVWPGKAADSVSSDGRYLAFIDWNTGNLAVRDLVTSRDRPLTKEASWGDATQFAETCAFAPDGKQIAFGWYKPGASHFFTGLE